MTFAKKFAMLALAMPLVTLPALAQHTPHEMAAVPAAAADSAALQATQVRVGPTGDHLVTGQGESEHAPPVDFITPHITDAHELETPFGAIELPRWEPVHVGGLTIDLSPTKHVVMLLIAALLCVIVLVPAAAAHERHTREKGAPKGWAAGIEAVVLYLRNEVIIPNVGHHGNKYVPFALTLFFFILFANLLGLIPYGSTATGNIAVTATLAIITFFVIEIAGMRALGGAYWRTIIYWPKDMPILMKAPMTLIMTPIEIVSKFTKPFALAIRLFANMTAGHVVLLALISLIFTFHSYALAIAPIALGVADSLLEILVATIQAFIFCLLASVFIGLIREGAH